MTQPANVDDDQITDVTAHGRAGSERADFPVVGIGASAGGLAATTELLRHLGPRPGVAVVIVQHLDPSHECSLVEILAKAAELPVLAAQDGLLVASNRVYVAPPNAGLLLVGSTLKLTPRIEVSGLHLPIDRFFESLAIDCEADAIGVLLTGTGSDGAQGIKAIKAEGGITFAQDDSAEHLRMPANAIAAGCADLVMPPAEIAVELGRLGARAPTRLAGLDAETEFRRILAILLRETGVDFANYKHTTVRRRIQRRGSVHRLQTLAEYAQLLERCPDEASVLCEEILIHATSFCSSNEALRSANAELQIARKELEAINQELRSVNDEMNLRDIECTLLSDDMKNMLSSVEIPIVILGRDLRLRCFTPAAAKVLGFVGSDLGRTITDLKPSLEVPEFGKLVGSVLEELSPVSRAVRTEEGHWYQLTIRPYSTTDNRVDGTVITMFDIDEVKKGEQLISQARTYAESIVDTVRECLVVLESDLRVRSANRAFYRSFALTPEGIEGRYLYELGHGEWRHPSLRAHLESLGEGDKLEDFCLDQELSGVGSRAFVLNARRIERTSSILLALQEVTEQQRAAGAVRRAELGFRNMLTTAAEAILMTDVTGRIVFANHAVTQVFGFEGDELLGQSVDVLVPERLRAGHEKLRAGYSANPSSRPMGRGDQELAARKKDGTEFPVAIMLDTMEREGEPLVVSFITDITPRRESERQIRQYRDKLQRMAFDGALAEERERRRIAADLHDRIGQSLALAQIKLTTVREATGGAVREVIDEAVDLVAHAVVHTRTLTFELSPPVLYDLGLKDALSWLVEDIEKRQGIRVEIEDDGVPKPLNDETAALVFRAVRELLMNVFKHAKTTTAKVSLRRTGEYLDIIVEDQGVGFNPDEVNRQCASGSFGLFSVREQISRLGGTVQVAALPQRGTRVSIRVSLRAEGPPTTSSTEASA